MPRADLQNIRDECFCALSVCLASALIYLEVHEEIFNEITSCLCVSDVALYRIAVFTLFLPTQSEGLFGGDMNTPNSNFGGLNVKHDELKKREKNGEKYFSC